MGQRGWIHKKRSRWFTSPSSTDPLSFQSVTAIFPGHWVAARGKRRWTGATPPFCCPVRARGCCAIHICTTPPGGVAPVSIIPCGKASEGDFWRTCCGPVQGVHSPPWCALTSSYRAHHRLQVNLTAGTRWRINTALTTFWMRRDTYPRMDSRMEGSSFDLNDTSASPRGK